MDGMPPGKSAGAAGKLSTAALIVGITLILIAGALVADVFLLPTSGTTSSSSARPQPSTQVESSTSLSGGESTSTSTSSLASQPASSSSATGSSTSTTAAPTSTVQSSVGTTTSTYSSSTTSSATSGSTHPGTVQITLPDGVGNNESLNFVPSKIKVVIGVNNTIVWNDLDYVQHTVQSVVIPSGAKPWNSGILNEGQTFTVVLTVPGSYKYDCSIHPDWMVGTIQVVQ